MVDKQEGVYAGGKAEYTGVRTFEVYADYQKSCLDDIRLTMIHQSRSLTQYCFFLKVGRETSASTSCNVCCLQLYLVHELFHINLQEWYSMGTSHDGEKFGT